MRKHLRLFAGMTAVLLTICSPSGFVYAEDPNNSVTYNSVTYVVNSNEADGLKDTKLTLEYNPDQVNVAIAAWNQWDGALSDTILNDIKTRNDNNSFFKELSGSSDITLKGFWSTTNVKRGDVVAVLTPKSGFLITGLNNDTSLNNYYPTQGFDLEKNSTIKYYTGISTVAGLAYKKGYKIIFGYSRPGKWGDPENIGNQTISSEAVDITVTAVPTKVNGKAVTDVSNVTVIPGDVVEITSTITPTKINSDSAALTVDFERDEQNNPVLSETINETTTALKDGDLTKNADGSWTRTTSYTVTADDSVKGEINYSIFAGLSYSASLHNVQLITEATKEAHAESTIKVISHTLFIKGNSQEFTYDGETHTVAGASVNGVACIPDPDENNNLSATVTLAGTNYQVSNIVNQPASGIDAKPDYTNSIDTSGIVIKKINDDGTLEPVADMNAFNVVPENGVMKINRASLSLAQVPDVTYDGQDQTLNKAQEQVIANAVSYLKPEQSADAANAVSVNAVSATNPPTPVFGTDYTLQYEVVSGNATDAGSVLRVTAVAVADGNYTGSSNPVDYKILPRPLRVGTNSDSKIYDGKPLTAAGSIDGAVASDHLRLITTGTQTSVGSSQNTYTIDYDYGNAKASNYKVVGESIGTLTVYAPAAKPSGRTCQQDGYPAGYAWDDAQQACVLRVTSVTPSIKAVPSTGAH